MAKAAKKKRAPAIIVFSRARDIPFNRIRLSEANVRQTGVEAGVDHLARDIDRREDLIQGLNVRVVLDADGNETGDFETPAGGRRYRSIARLAEAGRFPPPMALSPASSRRPTPRPRRPTTRWQKTHSGSRCIRSISSRRSSAWSTAG